MVRLLIELFVWNPRDYMSPRYYGPSSGGEPPPDFPWVLLIFPFVFFVLVVFFGPPE